MSFDPNNAPTGSPEEVLGDDDGGAQPFEGDDDDTQVEGGDIDTDTGGGGDTDTSGTRTTAPDPSDPPDPDPSDVTRDPDPSDPDPAPDPDQQQAEGADDPAATPDDDLEAIERSEGRDRDTSPDEPAEPTPTTPSGPGSEFGPPPEDPPTPEEADTTTPGGAVQPEPVETAPPGPKSAGQFFTDPSGPETFDAAPMAAGSTQASALQRFRDAPLAAGPTNRQLAAGRDRVAESRQAAEGAELNILPDQFRVEAEGPSVPELAESGVAGGRRAFERGEAADSPFAPVLTPPGDVEQTLFGPFTGPKSDLEQDIADSLEDAAQPFLGPPGGRERAVGGAVAEGTQTLEDVGEDVSGLTRPFGGFAGETVGTLPAELARVFGAEGAAADIEGAFESLGQGVGGVPGELLASGESIRQLSDVGFEATQDVTVEAASGDVPGAAETAVAGLTGTAVAAGAGIAGQFAENPFETTGAVAGGFVVGSAGARLLERGATAARLGINRRRTQGEIDVEDVTAEDTAEALARGDTSELPTFETSPGAPTAEAVGEFRERAEDAPDTLQEAVGSEAVTLRSESQRLGRDVDVEPSGEGGYELSGLFTSADLSSLRFELSGGGSSTLSSFNPTNWRFPRLTGNLQRASAFETEDIEGIPGSRGMAGETQFLEETAEEGTAFVRGGTRTRELEALFPPGTAFERTGTFSLNLPRRGEGGTLDVLRRPDGDTADADDLLTGREIVERERQSRRVSETEPVGPPVTGPAGTGTTAGGTTPDPFGFTSGAITPSESFFGSAGVSAPTRPTETAPSGTTAPSSPFTRPTAPATSGGLGSDPTGVTEPAGATEPAGVSEPTAPSDPTGLFTGTPTGPTPSEPSGPSTPTWPPSEPTSPPSEPTIPGVPTTPTTPPGEPGSPPGPPSGPSTPGVPGIPGTPPQPPQRPFTPESEPDRDDEEFQPLAPQGTEFYNPVATGRDLLGFGGGGGGSTSDAETGGGLFGGGNPFEGDAGQNPFTL